MTRLGLTAVATILGMAVFAGPLDAAQVGEESGAPEKVYQGEMAAYPGPWAFALPKSRSFLSATKN